MKRNIALAVCVLFILCHAASGQEGKKVQEPEYLGIFFLIDPNTGNLISLERQPAEAKVKVKAMGFGGGETSIEFKGEKSPVRFKEGQNWNSSCWLHHSKLIRKR